MDNTKDDSYYIKKMMRDIAFIIENTKEITQDALENNEVLCDSILFRMIQISENSVKLTPMFKESHNDIPWHAIKGMRNKIVHEYGDVVFDVVYQTVVVDIPEIYGKLNDLI